MDAAQGVAIGSEAPDFTLPSHLGDTVTLSDYRGRKNVVVVFYPLAFTSTCTGELCALRDERADFIADDVALVAISCDATPSLAAFAKQEGYDYPLLSDFYPHGAVSKAYGVFFEPRGFPLRGTFLIDKDGIVRWSVVNGPGDARANDDYRAALAAIRANG